MLKATKVRIYPTPEQAEFLNRQFGAVRFVYNKSLHIMSSQYRRHGLKLNAKHDMKKLLPIAKRSRKYSWLKDFDSIALQQACLNLDQAFKNFFNPKLPARYPQFKRRRSKQSSYHCTSVSVGENWIKIPKMKPVKARIHREQEGQLKSITLSKTSTGKYYASLLVECGQKAPSPAPSLTTDQVLGADMGLTHLLIGSNARKVANPRFLARATNNLRRKQKKLSRCQKGSKRRAKARLLVAKAHENVVNARNDFQHKLSRQLVDENQAIIVETLKVKNLLKNSRLAKHISDARWSRLIEMLEYKSEHAGKRLVKLDPWYPSSKTCSCCGHKLETLSLSTRTWSCPSCLVEHDRDLNAALNIKQQGIMQLKAEGCPVSASGGLCKTGEMLATA